MRVESKFDRIVTASFLPRDAMRRRGLCCRPVSVRPSVCLSRWWIVSKLLVRPGSFLDPSDDTQFQGEPLRRAQNTRGRENLRFRVKSLFISETVRDRLMVAMEH